MLNNFTITFQVLAYSPFMMIFHLTVVNSRIVAQVLRIISSGHWTSETLFSGINRLTALLHVVSREQKCLIPDLQLLNTVPIRLSTVII